MPPIPKNKNCNRKHKKATITPLKGPSKIATNGIINKCMGTPNGEGIDKEDTATVAAARIAALTSFFSLSSFLDSLNKYMVRVKITKIQ